MNPLKYETIIRIIYCEQYCRIISPKDAHKDSFLMCIAVLGHQGGHAGNDDSCRQGGQREADVDNNLGRQVSMIREQ